MGKIKRSVRRERERIKEIIKIEGEEDYGKEED